MTRVALLALACSVACDAQLSFDSWSDEEPWLPSEEERSARRGAGVSTGPGSSSTVGPVSSTLVEGQGVSTGPESSSTVGPEPSTTVEGQGVSTGPGSVATIAAEELANPVERDTAKIVWKVTGLDYSALTLDEDLMAKFKHSQVQLIINAWGTISAEQVEVKLSAGSVVVDIAVQAAANQTVEMTDIKVPDAGSILSAVAAIDGIDAAKCSGCELSVEEPSVSLYKAGSTSGRTFLDPPTVAVVVKTTSWQPATGSSSTSFLGVSASASAAASASISTTPISTSAISRDTTSTDVAGTLPTYPDITQNNEMPMAGVSGACPQWTLSGIVTVLPPLLAFVKL